MVAPEMAVGFVPTISTHDERASRGRIRRTSRRAPAHRCDGSCMGSTLRHSTGQAQRAGHVGRSTVAKRHPTTPRRGRIILAAQQEAHTMIVVRNVFHLKFGKAREALAVFKETMAL